MATAAAVTAPATEQPATSATADAPAPAAAPATSAPPSPPSTTPGEPTDQTPGSDGSIDSTEQDVDDSGVQMSDEEKTAFHAGLKTLPAAQRALINKFLTQKTQSISAKAKLIAQLEADPIAFANEILEFSNAKATSSAPATPATAAGQPATPGASDDVTAAVREALGEDYGFLADKLGPAIGTIIRRAIEPVASTVQAQQTRAINDTALATLKKFEAEHPDFMTHMPAMTEAARELKPSPGMDHGKYLGMLYTIATAKQSSATKARTVLAALAKAAGASETPASGVPAARVTPTAPRTGNFDKDFDSAFAMAKRGERAE